MSNYLLLLLSQQGSFITDGHEYFVERKENQQGNSSSNIHIIYRRLDTVRKQHRDPQTFCGLKGKTWIIFHNNTVSSSLVFPVRKDRFTLLTYHDPRNNTC